MQFGIWSQGEGRQTPAALTFKEDMHEVIVADEIGFQEAWIAEHWGSSYKDVISAVDPFLCQAALMTQQIKLGPGVRSLPYHHPLSVAAEAAVVDNLLEGRYMAGFGVGGVPAGARQHGVAPEVQRAMTHEAMDLIMRAWTADEPFDFEGKFWQGTGIDVNPKPFQKPFPPTSLACLRSIETPELAGKKGLIPLISHFSSTSDVHAMGDAYLRGAAAAGRTASRSDLRVTRYVHVSDSVEQGKRELHATDNAEKRIQMAHGMARWDPFIPEGRSRDDVNLDFLIDEGHFAVGDPDTVYECLRKIYEDSGGFGVLMLLTGKNWVTSEQRDRSMRLFAEHVAPRLAVLDPDD
jgi:alkanesulfonate monooxygenase SsuD/methylene tetrahydromethanopterin reductase-like flavin-dependent oxidoreductase (luciferase family)